MKGLLGMGAAYLGVAMLIVVIALQILAAFERATDRLQNATTSTLAPIATDFPVCVTVKPRPLIDGVRGNYDYRLGRGRRDGGIS